jgi:hypothetical protein
MLSREQLEFPWDFGRDWQRELNQVLPARYAKITDRDKIKKLPAPVARLVKRAGLVAELYAWVLGAAFGITVLGVYQLANMPRAGAPLVGAIFATFGAAILGGVLGNRMGRFVGTSWIEPRLSKLPELRNEWLASLRPQLDAVRSLLQDAEDYRRSLEGVDPFAYGKQYPESFRPDVAADIKRVHDDARNPIRNPNRRQYLARMVKEIVPQEFNQGHLTNEELEALMLYYYDAEYLAAGGAGTVPPPPPAEPEMSIEEEIEADLERHHSVYDTLRQANERIEQATEHMPEPQRTAERAKLRRNAERVAAAAAQRYEARRAKEQSTTDARN